MSIQNNGDVGAIADKLQQPEIEFLATNKFGLMPTGSRILNGLSVTTKGANPYTLQSGKSLSPLFGEALQVGLASGVYFDVADDSLSFSGSNSNVGPFTMGAYAWGPAANNKFWLLIVPHSVTISGDLWYNSNKWRLGIFLSATTAESFSMAYTSADGTTSNYFPDIKTVPAELRAGWIHVAYTYDPTNVGGTLKGYLNGVPTYTRNNYVMTAYGPNGAYVLKSFLTLFTRFTCLLKPHGFDHQIIEIFLI